MKTNAEAARVLQVHPNYTASSHYCFVVTFIIARVTIKYKVYFINYFINLNVKAIIEVAEIITKFIHLEYWFNYRLFGYSCSFIIIRNANFTNATEVIRCNPIVTKGTFIACILEGDLKYFSLISLLRLITKYYYLFGFEHFVVN